MKTLIPVYIGLPFLLLLFQTYLIFYVLLFFLQRLKLLKRPYNGMEDSEVLIAAVTIAGVLLISSADAVGLFQAAKSYSDQGSSIGSPLFLFFTQSFLAVLFFSCLYVLFNFLNLRFLFRAYYPAPGLVTSILASIIALALAVVCWLTCREIIDSMAPRFINFP